MVRVGDHVPLRDGYPAAFRTVGLATISLVVAALIRRPDDLIGWAGFGLVVLFVLFWVVAFLASRGVGSWGQGRRDGSR